MIAHEAEEKLKKEKKKGEGKNKYGRAPKKKGKKQGKAARIKKETRKTKKGKHKIWWAHKKSAPHIERMGNIFVTKSFPVKKRIGQKRRFYRD